MMHEFVIDYPKFWWKCSQHRQRYAKRAKQDNLICQECGGGGGHTEIILDDGTGPWEECGWCEGIGYITKWDRGLWLRFKKGE